MNIQSALRKQLPDPLFCAWFSGLVDGEGCFDLRLLKVKRGLYWRAELRVAMSVRELPYIENLQRNINCGTVCVIGERSRPIPLACWSVKRSSDLVDTIIPIFDAHPLRMKKSDDYILWREAAMLIHAKMHLEAPGFHRLTEINAQLHKQKRPYTGAEIEARKRELAALQR